MTDSGPNNLHFKPVIRSLFDGTEGAFAKMTDDHHRLPIILTLLRMLWGTKEVNSSPLSDLIHGQSINAQNRKSFLEVLDHFINSLTDPAASYMQASRMGVVHIVHTIHMAHLIGAGNMMDWLYSVLRGGPDAGQARVRMKCAADQDPKRIREITYRSAQILSMIKQYPYNLPQEPFNAFHAGAILWCAADLLSRQSQPEHMGDDERRQAVLRLDYLGTAHDAETLAIQAWVRDGGPQIISLYTSASAANPRTP
jgi:hypothetical protein